MFYVCKKSTDGTFGVMDTEDGKVDYFTPREIGKIITKMNIPIEGASIVDGKLRLTVKKPMQFADVETVETDGIEQNNEVVDLTGHPIDELILLVRMRQFNFNTTFRAGKVLVPSGFKKQYLAHVPVQEIKNANGKEYLGWSSYYGKIYDYFVEPSNSVSSSSGLDSVLPETGWASSFEGLEENTPYSEFIDKYSDTALILVRAINKLAGRITGLTAESVVELDGWDCVGFDYVVSSLNSDYAISVYANPQVTVVKEGNGYKLIGVDVSGFGCDIMKNGDTMEHIDCDMKNWEKDIEESDGWKLLNGSKHTNWLDGLDKDDFDALVHPLYERIANVASRLCNMEFYDFNVTKFDDSWDLVGIKQKGVQFNLYDIDVHVQSTGCWHYNKNGDSLPLDVIVEYWNTSGIDKVDIPFKYHKYVIVSKNNITINIPENEFENGLNAAVAVKRYIVNIQ